MGVIRLPSVLWQLQSPEGTIVLCRLLTSDSGIVKIAVSEVGGSATPYEVVFTDPALARDTATRLAHDYRLRGWTDCV
jgi:hypothetical protein